MLSRHTPYHMLAEAFERRGCPVCAIVQEIVFRHLDLLIHENVNDLEFREQLRKAGGFCNSHAWWLATRLRNAALGSAIMYRDVLNALRGRLAQAATGGTLFGAPRRRRGFGPFQAAPGAAAEPHADCPICLLRTREEEAFLDALLAHTQDAPFMHGYRASDGLCFVHLDQGLALAKDPSAVRLLLGAQAEIVDRLIAELDEFQRKADYRYYDELPGHEADSWKRAIELVNGRDGVR